MFERLGNLTPFDGKIDRKDLPYYHYKILMPYFTDPDWLKTFRSLEEGLALSAKI